MQSCSYAVSAKLLLARSSRGFLPRPQREGAPSSSLSATYTCGGAKHGGQSPIILHAEQIVKKRSLQKAWVQAHRQTAARYRGRTLLAPEHPTFSEHAAQALPHRHRSAEAFPEPTRRRITVMTYNCGGLAQGLYHEMLEWLHAPDGAAHAPDIVFIQETHWSKPSDWDTHDWYVQASCMSAHQAGLLTLISKRRFPQAAIRTKAVVEGRLMCTRLEAAGVVYTLLNVYQKALDHKPGTQAERDAVWDALRQELTHCPKRHELIIAGDFNTGLQARSPEVGSAVHRAGQAAKAKDQVTMQQLLRQFDLRALNTFHPYPLHTTYRHDQADKIKSQVDYILVRGRQTDQIAKRPHILCQTKLADWRGGSKHWPILASIPAKYFHAAPPPRERPRQAGGHEGHVSKTVTLIYQEQVQRHIEKLNEWDTEVVNDILHRTAESTILLLPTPKEPAEARPAPVKRMWQCHHDIKQLQRQGPGNEDRVLALKQEFKDLQKQIRNHSQTKRKHYLEERVKLATAAAERGDARALHQQIKRLTPKVPKSKVHLRGKEGQLLSTAQELRLISTYWQNLYTGETITRPITSQAIQITMEEACKAIASLPSHKALPKHYTSSEAWKLAASPLATLLHRTILAQWQAGVITIPQEWKDAWLCLLLKPGKSGRSPDEYRPIGLTDPIGKALLGAIANKHQQTYYQSLHSLPQFAYLPGRGTAQAIARVGQHIHEVKNLVSGQKLTLHHRHAGERQQDLVGGIIVSLDMTKAFDRLEPQHMQNALAASKLPDEVQTLILEWHQGVTYHICHERQDAEIRCSRGIRQGCKIAPRVWALFTALLMHKLGEDWCRDNTTWFADDILFHLQFSNRSELLASIKAIAFALQVIEDLGMQIAAGKSAVLLHLGGAHSRRMRKSLIVMHENKPHLAFQHQARVWHLPLVDKHDYLGIVLSYTRLEEHTATRRINSAQAAFAKLKPVLTHKRMPLELRIRLWKTCVLASLYYGLPQVGLTPHTVRRITVLVHKQLRHITSMPVHLTHISNQDLRDRHGVSQPIAHITAIAQKQLEEAMAVKHDLEADDARIHSLVLKKEKRVAGLLATLMQAESAQQAEDLTLSCPQCERTFTTLTALKKHHRTEHSAPVQDGYEQWKQVDRHAHGSQGLPICRWCSKPFHTWQNLQRHIYANACLSRDWQHHLQHPSSTGDTTLQNAHEATPESSNDKGSAITPTHELTTSEAERITDLPCIQWPNMLETIANHTPLSVLQQFSNLRQELTQHCCLCRQWTTGRGGTKIHMRGSHADEWKKAGAHAEHACLQYAKDVTYLHGCPYCQTPKFADRRAARAHSQNCQVLFQIQFMKLAQAAVAVPVMPRFPFTLRNGNNTHIMLPVPTGRTPNSQEADFLRDSCCGCGQKPYDPRSLKMHLQKAHPDIWIPAEEIEPHCKTFLLPATKQCPYCRKTFANGKTHGPVCPVIFQFCTLAAHGLGGPGHPGTDHAHLEGTGGASCQTSPPRSSRGTASEGQRQREGQKIQQSPWHLVQGAREKQLHGSGPSHGGHGQAVSPAGSGTQRITAREGLYPAFGNSLSRDSQPHRAGVHEMERALRAGQGGLQPTDLPVPPSTQGDSSSPGEVRSNAGKHRGGGEAKVGDGESAAVDVQSLEPRQQEGRDRRNQKATGPRGCQAAPDDDGRSPKAGPRGAAPVQSPTQAHGRDARKLSGVQNICGSEGGTVPTPLPGIRGAQRAVGPEPHRGKPSQRAAKEQPRGRHCTTNGLDSRLRLRNPLNHNYCYMNTVFQAFLHTWQQAGSRPGMLGKLGVSGKAALGLPQPVLIANMLAFQTVLRGWANPKMQHDVAEFLHHIVRASNMPYGWGRWEVRRHIHDALTVVDSGCLRAPIAIAMPNAPTHLTTCLRQHFIGDSTQLALVDAPDMLCCQLFRYTVSAEGMTSKNEIRVDYDRQPILIPQWSDMHSLQTCNIPYQITAVALHAGHTPHCGHYRAHLLEDCANLIADDDVVRLCTAQDEHDVQTTSYVFFLRRLSNATGSIDAAPTIEL